MKPTHALLKPNLKTSVQLACNVKYQPKEPASRGELYCTSSGKMGQTT